MVGQGWPSLVYHSENLVPPLQDWEGWVGMLYRLLQPESTSLASEPSSQCCRWEAAGRGKMCKDVSGATATPEPVTRLMYTEE